MAPFFLRLLRLNRLEGGHYLEPFAGGAGVGLSLLRAGVVRRISLNDIDRSVYAFWYAVTQRNAALRKLVERTPVSLKEWDHQKEIQREKATAPLLELGFSTLFLNRTNRSGILRAGVIGGRAQTGDWRMDARYDKERIRHRIEEIRALARRISVSQLDAVDFLRDNKQRRSARIIAYLDPPYIKKGPDLYLNRLTESYHRSLASYLLNEASYSWVLTYDDSVLARRLYKRLRIRTFRLGYSADARRTGRELLMTSPQLASPHVIARR